MIIRSSTGVLLYDILIAEAAQFEQELMKSDQVTLSWNSDENTVIPVGTYIEYKGEKYSLLDPYTPVQKNEVEWAYTPVFKSETMRWSKVPFFFYTYSSDDTITGRETDWVLTDTPSNFMSKVCESIKNETGALWTYSVDASLAASMTITFSSVDIFSALNSIANAFETEWWVDKTNKVLHLSKASFGEAVLLEVDSNIGVPTVQSQNGKEYYNRFYAFGSTRNIPQDYSGANVNNLTNKRLTLDPAVYPGGYKDTVEGLTLQTALSKILVFDEIYPHSDLEISDVRARLRYVLDENGNKVQVGTDDDGNPVYDQYAIWYFKISGFTFNNTTYDEESNPNGMLLPGLTLSVHFRSGALTGREFELAYHDAEEVKNDSADVTPFTVEAGDYEILYIKEGSYIIPAQTGIVPADGDDVTLFNIKMPDSYNATAYDELEDALNEAIEEYTSDLNSYTSKSNPVAFNTSDPGLVVGRNVTYKNGSYTLSTRVTKIIKKLDYECEQTITFGNSVVKGSTQELKEDVVLANRNIDILTQLNQLSNQLTQSYNRVQQSMIEGFARIGNMWKFDPDDPDNTIYTPFNVYSEKAVSAGGKGTGGDVPAGVTTLSALEDVSLSDLAVGQVLQYNGEKWVNANAAGGISSLTINLGTVSYKGVGTTDVTVNLPAYYSVADSDNRYLQLSGGTMSGDITMTGHALVWHDQTAYDDVPTGLMGVSVVNDSALGFSTCISFKNYYGLQIAAHGGANDFYIRGHNHIQWNSWYELLHTGNIGSFALTPSNYASYLDSRYARTAYDNNLIYHTNEFNFIPSGYSSQIAINYRTQGGLNGSISQYMFYNGSGQLAAISVGGITINGYAALQNFHSVNEDLNTLVNSGVYRLESANINGPVDSPNYSQMLVMHGYSNTIAQMIINYASADVYVRAGNPPAVGGNGTWTQWYTLARQLTSVDFTNIDCDNVQVYNTMSTMAKRLTLNWGSSSMARIYAITNDGISTQDLMLGSTATGDALYYDALTARWGIGTNAPTQKLHVVGNIVATGEVSAGNASDRRLKKDISILSERETAHVLSHLNPVSFTWNAKAEELSGGGKKGIARSFVADEFLSLLPNAGRKMWNDYDAIYTEQAVPYLVKGWQMHDRQLSEHEKRILALERENAELKRELSRRA